MVDNTFNMGEILSNGSLMPYVIFLFSKAVLEIEPLLYNNKILQSIFYSQVFEELFSICFANSADQGRN